LPLTNPLTSLRAGAQKIGVVSVSGASNLSTLENELASKAAASGASSYRIISAGGQNKLYGTAEIFN
jgi:multiple stress resistance protein BhsA